LVYLAPDRESHSDGSPRPRVQALGLLNLRTGPCCAPERVNAQDRVDRCYVCFASGFFTPFRSHACRTPWSVFQDGTIGTLPAGILGAWFLVRGLCWWGITCAGPGGTACTFPGRGRGFYPPPATPRAASGLSHPTEQRPVPQARTTCQRGWGASPREEGPPTARARRSD